MLMLAPFPQTLRRVVNSNATLPRLAATRLSSDCALAAIVEAASSSAAAMLERMVMG
jgi:hypothetical protein